MGKIGRLRIKWRSFRERWLLFKWTVGDTFRYLFRSSTPEHLQANWVEVCDNHHRLGKLNPYER